MAAVVVQYTDSGRVNTGVVEDGLIGVIHREREAAARTLGRVARQRVVEVSGRRAEGRRREAPDEGQIICAHIRGLCAEVRLLAAAPEECLPTAEVDRRAPVQP